MEVSEWCAVHVPRFYGLVVHRSTQAAEEHREELGLELRRGGAGILRQLRFTPQTPDGSSAGCGCSTRKGHKR